MTGVRILHVDDEPDIREVVELSLELNPAFTVKSCASGSDALAVAADWSPDLILCDVMMPVMDGPATLARLRQQPETAKIPVVFMTARAQPHEFEQFKALGATGVIAKPFDPLSLALSVRDHLYSAGLASLRENFLKRLRGDAEALVRCRAALEDDPASPIVLQQIRAFAHALSGAAGIFGFPQISHDAAALENMLVERTVPPEAIDRALDGLLATVERE
jgi:CheY-like chemotaxis protein